MADRDFQALLDANALLAGLDPLSRTALGMHFVSQRFAPGERVFEAGAHGDRMLLILSGTAEVRAGDDHVLATLGPDNLVGEVAFFGRVAGRTASVSAKGEVVAAVLTREIYDRMIETDPGAAETIEKVVLDVMLARVANTNERTVALVAAHQDDPVFKAEARMMASKG